LSDHSESSNFNAAYTVTLQHNDNYILRLLSGTIWNEAMPDTNKTESTNLRLDSYNLTLTLTLTLT